MDQNFLNLFYFFTSHIVTLLHLIQILNSNPTLWYKTPIDFSDIEINATFVSTPNVLWLENILIFGVWFVRKITNEPVANLSTIWKKKNDHTEGRVFLVIDLTTTTKLWRHSNNTTKTRTTNLLRSRYAGSTMWVI